MQVNWNEITHFSPREWPDGVLDYMSESIIYSLNEWRNMLPNSHSMTPSPLFDAHVRFKGSSRHSTEGGRKSDATDIFIKPEHIFDAWIAAQQVGSIGGIGVYVDTRPTTMMHIDNRPGRMLWVRDNGEYTYYHRDPVKFFKVMSKIDPSA